MDYQRLYSYTRRAISDYDMIDSGDEIAVAVSGGKDSIALALALKGLERFYPKHFHVRAFTVSIGFEGMDFEPIKQFFEEKEIPFEVIKTNIREIVFDIRKEKNPCALCATLRKGALYSRLKELGITKVALGHNREDVVETLMLSLLYEGRIHTFQPITELDRTGITVIRPLIYTPEKEIVDFKNRYSLPILKNNCPVDGITKRQEVSDLLTQLSKNDHLLNTRLLTAIQTSGIDGWKSGENYRIKSKGAKE